MMLAVPLQIPFVSRYVVTLNIKTTSCIGHGVVTQILLPNMCQQLLTDLFVIVWRSDTWLDSATTDIM